ncbi:MAG: hypothetical protein ACJ0G4_04835 [Alphaproteobacteria bacterium]
MLFMQNADNIIKFPNLIDKKKKRFRNIRDDIERILSLYALEKNDLWAVSLAAGRFSSINLEKLEGEESTIKFFKSCINTQKKYESSRNSTNIT